MLSKIAKSVVLLLIIAIFPLFSDAQVAKIPFKYIEIENVSRYDEDRVIYQQVEINHVQYKHDVVDNSLATLLIIRDRKMYLFKDGHDNPEEIAGKKLVMDMENKLVDDVWFNKMNGIPDYLRITDRRVELQKMSDEKFVSEYKDMYLKIRNAFIQKHIDIFRAHMIDRKTSNLYVTRTLVPRKVYDKESKFKISVSASTIHGTVYYAEDADGDGITETFSVKIADGFHWGYKSGPNVILIYNNKQEDIKKMIGGLTQEAYYGTPEEKKAIKETFPAESTLLDMIDYLYQMDRNHRKLLDKSKK